MWSEIKLLLGTLRCKQNSSHGKGVYSSFDDTRVSFMPDDFFVSPFPLTVELSAVQREEKAHRKSRGGIVARLMSTSVG